MAPVVLAYNALFVGDLVLVRLFGGAGFLGGDFAGAILMRQKVAFRLEQRLNTPQIFSRFAAPPA